MDDMESPNAPQFTGRVLMVAKPKDSAGIQRNLNNAAGLNIASSRDYDGQEVPPKALSEGDGIYLDEIGVTILTVSDAEQLDRAASVANIMSDEDGPIMEPEQILYALGEDVGEYLRGFRDAAAALAENLGKSQGSVQHDDPGVSATAAFLTNATWGLKSTRTVVSPPLTQQFTGKGIKVCVLDTGMDLRHPDFAGRVITSKSFIDEDVQDGHSHGTHCVGTSCGPKSPSGVQRYGIAYEADIFVGKVLNNVGKGPDGAILAGINWAVANRCEVISMSLGAPVSINDGGFSPVYENAARAALAAGCLIIAAAGNESENGLQPVGRPANSPSIMAVAAVGRNLTRAAFSNVTFFPPHGKVDIAGPGVGIFSSVPTNKGTHGTKSGTSMATPHVAGIAALHAQANRAHRGAQLWQRLIATATTLQQPAGHVGAGLVQAPWSRIPAHTSMRERLSQIISEAEEPQRKARGKAKAAAKVD